MQALHPFYGMVENFVQSKEVKEILASIFKGHHVWENVLRRVSRACIEVKGL